MRSIGTERDVLGTPDTTIVKESRYGYGFGNRKIIYSSALALIVTYEYHIIKQPIYVNYQ